MATCTFQLHCTPAVEIWPRELAVQYLMWAIHTHALMHLLEAEARESLSLFSISQVYCI